MPMRTVGPTAPASPGPFDEWLSTALGDSRFPAHPGNTIVVADSLTSATSIQEPNVFLYNSVVFLLCNQNGGLRLYTAADPRQQPYTDRGYVVGGGLGGEAASCIHPSVVVDGTDVYVYYVPATNSTTVKVARASMAALASSPGTAFSVLGTVATRGSTQLASVAQFGNFSVLKMAEGNYRMWLECLYGGGGDNWTTLGLEATTPAGPFTTRSGPMQSLSPRSVLGMSYPGQPPVQTSLFIEGYRGFASAGPVVAENGGLTMLYHGGDVGAGDGNPWTDIYMARSFDGGDTWTPQLAGWPKHARRDSRWELDQVADPYPVLMPGGVWWAYWTAASNPNNRFLIKAAPLSPTLRLWDGYGWVDVTQQAPIDGRRALVPRRRYAISGQVVFPFEDVPVDPGGTADFALPLPVAACGVRVGVAHIGTGVGTVRCTARSGDTFGSSGTATDATAIAKGQRVEYECLTTTVWTRLG